MIKDGITEKLVQAYKDMYETKKVKREAWVPESIKDEGVADFMGAAAAAAKAGKKDFKFGDKTYKVTMKKDAADAINDAVDVCEKCGKVHEGSCSAEEVEEAAEPEAKGEKDDGTQIQEAVKINKEPFKGTKAEVNVDRILTRAGFVYGKKPDALSFEEPAHTDPKTGNRVVIMSRGKQFAVSNAKGDTIQGPTNIAISMDPLFKWLEANKYKIR